MVLSAEHYLRAAQIRDIPPVTPVWPKRAPDPPASGADDERKKRRESPTDDSKKPSDDDHQIDEYV